MLNRKLNFAAIDIGSNAVRLLIKSVDEGEAPSEMTKALLLRIPLRLGDDAFRLGKISSPRAKQLMRTIKAFRLLMKVYRVTAYRACATSAMRDASNGAKIARAINNRTGIPIEIIDGQEEARIVYESHVADMLGRNGRYAYVDVGGGSTEISLICDGQLLRSHSYDIGTVRWLAGSVRDPDREALDRDLDALSASYPDLQIIGSGGNINKLYRMAPGAGNFRLDTVELRRMYEQMKDKTVEQRMEEFGLNADRADVIIPAAEIFLNIAGRLNAEYILVPTIGIIDGITHSLYAKHLCETEREG